MKKSMHKGSSNPVVQLLSSLQKHDDSDPYLILIQHSLSFSKRQTAMSTEKDLAVYRRANVRPPSQRAQFDLCGNLWIKELVQQFQSKIIWIETTGPNGMRPSVVSTSQHVVRMSAGADPLGWDGDPGGSCAEEKLSISNLHCLARKIVQEACSRATMIFLESIIPLITIHGIDDTVDFITFLLENSSSSTTLVIPIITDSLSQPHHVVLEDMAHAVLILEGGEATIMRRGVRERAHLLREQVQFDVDDNGNIHILASLVHQKESATEEMNPLEITNVKTVQNTAATVPAAVGGRRKITLQHDEEMAVVTNAPTPQIYLEDNDPEFDDMDEEDPDDDLDI